MADSLNFDNVFDIFQEEKKKGDLQPLSKDFYATSTEYIKELAQTEKGQNDAAKKTDNFKKLIASLRERRKQKILIYLAYNKSLPEKVPFEDEQLYIKLKNTIKEQGMGENKLQRLKINSDMPEIITPNGSKIGPFNQNQIIEISNNTDLEFLINNKVGEIIQM